MFYFMFNEYKINGKWFYSFSGLFYIDNLNKNYKYDAYYNTYYCRREFKYGSIFNIGLVPINSLDRYLKASKKYLGHTNWIKYFLEYLNDKPEIKILLDINKI